MRRLLCVTLTLALVAGQPPRGGCPANGDECPHHPAGFTPEADNSQPNGAKAFGKLARVWDDALYGPLFDYLQGECDAVTNADKNSQTLKHGKKSTYWMPFFKTDKEGKRKQTKPRFVAEQVVWELSKVRVVKGVYTLSLCGSMCCMLQRCACVRVCVCVCGRRGGGNGVGHSQFLVAPLNIYVRAHTTCFFVP